MIYTNMLFALGLDRVVFGQSPGLWSLAGSGLILGSAVFVAVRKGRAGNQDGRGSGGDVEMVGRGERESRGSGDDPPEEEMAMLGGGSDDGDEGDIEPRTSR